MAQGPLEHSARRIGPTADEVLFDKAPPAERPDAFRKVISHIGSYTNIRGGHAYEALVRKSAKRPMRIFLQDGSNDLDNQHGNWWLANLEMEAALKYKGYDYKFVGGEGGHNGKHGGAILPDSLRWLWRSGE